MGKRTSQTASPGEPRARLKRGSLLGGMIRLLAILGVIILALFLVVAWYYSGEIESGALEPPTSEPASLDWEVIASDPSTVTLLGSSSTDQAGEEGLSALLWENGYARSGGLISSTETGQGLEDRRSLESGQPVPPVGTDAKVDVYYWQGPDDIGVEVEMVTYRSDIGSFPAWYIPGTSDTWAIVVHGKGGTLEEALRIVPVLREQGYPILVINYRNDVGQPRDPSGYHTYGQTDWSDVAGAVRYANENGAVDHILVGYSYAGSMIASYLTQSPLRNFTRAVILDSPVLSFTDSVDYRASLTELPLLPVKLPQVLTSAAKWISTWRFDVDWAATDYLDQTNNIHAPMLIFHGTEDVAVPHSTSAEMASLRPDIVTLVTTAAGHTRSWNLAPEAYEAAITEFLGSID
ncbi:MAG TPA: alpha/beta hydrolase [Acidimicrobiia bacterium]|nr:alpha/beta hydrolase [Acidimicrobiia bacterium]